METVNAPMEEIVPVLLTQMEQGGTAWLVVTGSSMHPVFRNRKDRVGLCSVQDPIRGHPMVLYRRENGAYVLHRIVRHKKDGYLCCGDNQWQPEPVTRAQILAQVTEFTRKGKTYTVNQWGYRCFVWLWCAALPVRRPILALRRLLGKLRRKIRRK